MRRTLIMLVMIGVLPAVSPAQGVWSKLDMSEETMKHHVWNGLIDGSFNSPGVPALRAMPAGSRQGMITQMYTYGKTWSRSAEFKARYAEYREERKPTGPNSGGGDKSIAERKKADREAIQKAIKDIEANAKLVPADQQSVFKELLQSQKEMLKAIDDPNNPTYSSETQAGMAAGAASEAAERAAAIKEWEKKYPVSPTPLMRENLRAFIAMSSTVDFNAKLARSESGKMVFVNSAYESKPGEWKALFRAGKETTAALRAAAQQWLDELK